MRYSLPRIRPLLPRLPLRYVVADRHQIVCEGVGALLSECADLRCVGLACCRETLLEVLHKQQPDILLTGLRIRGAAALDVLRECHQTFPEMGLIVLSMHTLPLTLAEVARAGASAFVSKSEDRHTLIEIIFRVAAGQRGFFPEDTDFRHEPLLTVRELAVLAGIAAGKTVEEIGAQLRLSAKTIEVHRTSLLRRFGLRKSIDLVRVALEAGFVVDSDE